MEPALTRYDSVAVRKTTRGYFLAYHIPRCGEYQADDCKTHLHKAVFADFEDAANAGVAARRLLIEMGFGSTMRISEESVRQERGYWVYALETSI